MSTWLHPGQVIVRTRVREIFDEHGARLRLIAAFDQHQALVTLDFPDCSNDSRIVFDSFTAELLASFIMLASLAGDDVLPDEESHRGLIRHFRMIVSPVRLIEARRSKSAHPFRIPASYWSKLYAELSLITVHSRGLRRLVPVRLH